MFSLLQLLATQEPAGVDWVTDLLERGPLGLVALLLFAIWWLFKFYENKLKELRADEKKANEKLSELVRQQTVDNMQVVTALKGVHEEMARFVSKAERILERQAVPAHPAPPAPTPQDGDA